MREHDHRVQTENMGNPQRFTINPSKFEGPCGDLACDLVCSPNHFVFSKSHILVAVAILLKLVFQEAGQKTAEKRCTCSLIGSNEDCILFWGAVLEYLMHVSKV